MEELNLKFILNKMLICHKFHMLEIVVGNILFLTNIKKAKETVNIFLILALFLPKMQN